MKTLIFSLTMLVSLFISAQEKGASTIPADKTLQPGSTYAIVVGISNYQDEGIPDLRFADRDAEAFANFLRSPSGGWASGKGLVLVDGRM